jgi:hypothetical protein
MDGGIGKSEVRLDITHIKERMWETRPCASAFRPCFIKRFVKRSSKGSVFGGRLSGAYPRAGRADAGVDVGAASGVDDEAAEGVERTLRSAAKPEDDEPGEEEEDGAEEDSARWLVVVTNCRMGVRRARNGARSDMAADPSRCLVSQDGVNRRVGRDSRTFEISKRRVHFDQAGNIKLRKRPKKLCSDGPTVQVLL